MGVVGGLGNVWGTSNLILPLHEPPQIPQQSLQHLLNRSLIRQEPLAQLQPDSRQLLGR